MQDIPPLPEDASDDLRRQRDEYVDKKFGPVFGRALRFLHTVFQLNTSIFDVCQWDNSSAFRDKRLKVPAEKILSSQCLGLGPGFRSPAGHGEDLQHGDERGRAGPSWR